MKPKKSQVNQPRTAKPTSTTDRQGLISSNRLSDCRLPGHSIGQQRKTPNGSRVGYATPQPWSPSGCSGSNPQRAMEAPRRRGCDASHCSLRERQGKDGQRRASTGGPTPRDDGIRPNGSLKIKHAFVDSSSCSEALTDQARTPMEAFHQPD